MRRSVFLRCLLFYLLFLLVLMGMYVPLYRLNLNMITEKSVQVSETMLYSRLKQFEYELSQTRTLSTRLSAPRRLRSFRTFRFRPRARMCTRPTMRWEPMPRSRRCCPRA